MSINKEFNAASCQTLAIRADDPAGMDLFRRAYRDVYLPAFPLENERESLEKMEALLKGAVPEVDMVVVIAGQNLDRSDTADIYAMSVGYYYREAKTGLLAYNAVAPEHRSKGLGRKMVESRIEAMKDLAARDGAALEGVLIEVNDPAKIKPEDDSIDPATRIKIFEKWGAQKVPIPYVQPVLEPGGKSCDTLLLMSYAVDGAHIKPGTLKKFLQSVFYLCLKKGFEQDEAYLKGFERMMKVIDGELGNSAGFAGKNNFPKSNI